MKMSKKKIFGKSSNNFMRLIGAIVAIVYVVSMFTIDLGDPAPVEGEPVEEQTVEADVVEESSSATPWGTSIEEDTSEETSAGETSSDEASSAEEEEVVEPYIVENDNIPYFSDQEIEQAEVYAEYGELDALGRVTEANAVLGQELMPDKEREDISGVKPTGWQQAKYANVDGGWLYNRSHLIGFQLTGENANPKNLMTGTRYFNVEGMLPFENYVANYIEETGNLVRYRITPVFEGNNLLASGVFMEALSIEDYGESLRMNVYIPNVQPGVEIDYATGDSVGQQGPNQNEELPDLNG